MLEYADAVTYHTYHYDETMSMQRALALKGLTKHYGKDIEVVQGEMGSQSKSGGKRFVGEAFVKHKNLIQQIEEKRQQLLLAITVEMCYTVLVNSLFGY